MANGKRVQFARGTREQEDAVTGLEGELRVDLTRHEIRIHDGQKQGGWPMASRSYVESFLSGSGEAGTGGSLQFFASEAELKGVQPSSSVLAILREEGKEDTFVWQQGVAESGDITSDISGYWKRLDGQAGFAIMLARSGVITLQVAGTQPTVNQATTVWLDNGVIKLWDGATYINATPVRWMALFASVGGYSTAEFTLPDRLASLITESIDLNAIVATGWYKSSAAATGNPVAGVNLVEHRQISADIAIQFCYPPAEGTRGYYIRNRTDDVPLTWTAWSYVEGVIPARLTASQSTIADANSATESGFYRLAAGAANSPTANVAGLFVSRFDSNRMSQIAVTQTGDLAFRSREAGTWTSWVTASISTHTHDDRYYTESEMTTLLAGKAASVHFHDDRYYTEAEVNSLLAGKAPVGGASFNAIGSIFIASLVGAAVGDYPPGSVFYPNGTSHLMVYGLRSDGASPSMTYLTSGAYMAVGGLGGSGGLWQRVG